MGEHSEQSGQFDEFDKREKETPVDVSLWDDTEDLTALTEEELRAQLQELSAQEKEVSYRRRVLQGRIDLIRAEIVRKGQATLSPEELASVLLDSRSGEKGGEDFESGRES